MLVKFRPSKCFVRVDQQISMEMDRPPSHRAVNLLRSEISKPHGYKQMFPKQTPTFTHAHIHIIRT